MSRIEVTMSGVSKRSDQRGIVSIMVTMIMMLVITLIVIGFSQVSRRNQRESLDRQLSSQAYYAAESGADDVVSLLRGASHVSDLANDNTKCNNFTSKNGVSNKLLASANVEYTCVLVNELPPSYSTTVIANGHQSSFPVTFSLPLGSMKFTWDASDKTSAALLNPANCSTGRGVFPPAASWNCSYAILQVDITNITGMLTPYTPSALAANTVTTYFQPRPTADPLSLLLFGDPTHQTNLVGSSCTAAGTCTGSVNLVGGTDFLIHVSAIYSDARNVVMQGTSLAGTVDTQKGAQVIIDSTGRSQDELRRIQERVDVNQTNSSVTGGDASPDALTTSSSICKRFQVGIPSSPPVTTCDIP